MVCKWRRSKPAQTFGGVPPCLNHGPNATWNALGCQQNNATWRTIGRICRLAVDLLDYQSRFRQKAVDVHSKTYSGPFRRGRRDSLAARVGRSSSPLEP